MPVVVRSIYTYTKHTPGGWDTSIQDRIRLELQEALVLGFQLLYLWSQLSCQPRMQEAAQQALVCKECWVTLHGRLQPKKRFGTLRGSRGLQFILHACNMGQVQACLKYHVFSQAPVARTPCQPFFQSDRCRLPGRLRSHILYHKSMVS